MADFDWVSALSACSSAKAFEQLKLQVQADVKARNRARPEGAEYKFDTAVEGDSIAVLLAGKLGGRVTIQKTERGISVLGADDTPMFEALLTLNDEGECRLKVNGQEKEFWQVRRMALEDLLFNVV